MKLLKSQKSKNMIETKGLNALKELLDNFGVPYLVENDEVKILFSDYNEGCDTNQLFKHEITEFYNDTKDSLHHWGVLDSRNGATYLITSIKTK